MKNIIVLLTKAYKTTRGENPIIMNNIFTQKKAIDSIKNEPIAECSKD